MVRDGVELFDHPGRSSTPCIRSTIAGFRTLPSGYFEGIGTNSGRLSQPFTEASASMMMQANDPSVSAATLTSVGLGSVLADAGFSTGSGNAADWAQHIAALHAAARASRLHIPLLYGLDAVHGMSHARNAIIFPHNTLHRPCLDMPHGASGLLG